MEINAENQFVAEWSQKEWNEIQTEIRREWTDPNRPKNPNRMCDCGWADRVNVVFAIEIREAVKKWGT